MPSNHAIDDDSPPRPNLLIVLVDQMRYMAMGCAGNDQIRTPRLDAFAAEGTSMDGAVSNIPVCTPARACLLTGRYPLSHAALTNNSMLPTDIPSMGTLLRGEGYATHYIGKWHLAGEAYIGATRFNQGRPGYIPPGPMRHGFDDWAVHHCSHNYTNAFYYRDGPEPIAVDGWEPDVQTDLAIDVLRRHADVPYPQRKPFFLMLSWGPPHTPFGGPPEFESLYDPNTIRLRENVRLSPVVLNCDSRLPDPGMDDPEKVLRVFTTRYWAAISNLDWNMGRLLDALEALQLQGDTIVVFTSDHGEMLGSHGHMHKLQPWDESIRIPFLIRYPGYIPAGTRHDVPFGLPDVLPTLFSLLGIRIPAGVEGTDVSAALRGHPMRMPESTPLLWPCNAVTWGKRWSDCAMRDNGFPHGFMRPYRGIRTRTHTYVRDRSGPWFLYNNVTDPLQLRNLADDGAGAIPPELDTILDDWLERTGDAFATSDYYRNCIDLETGLVRNRQRLRRGRAEDDRPAGR